jgi:pimeloyl-ACP methyl ester carboxylesterase
MFHPTPPTTEELRRVMPGPVDPVEPENTGHWIQQAAASRLNAELIRFLETIGSP